LKVSEIPAPANRSRTTPGNQAPPRFAGDEIHLQILKLCLREQDRNAWNRWRKQNPDMVPDLRGVALTGARLARWDLSGALLDGARLLRADLQMANLERASLVGASLVWAVLCDAKARGADFSGANCRQAHFERADCRDALFLDRAYLAHANLREADFRGARMVGVNLSEASLRRTRMDGADLCRADLSDSLLDETDLRAAKLRGALVPGTFVRRVRIDAHTDQHELLAELLVAWDRKPGDQVITTEVDDLRVAQFHNIVDEPGAVGKLLAATTQRVVLILGRFTPRRKAVLNALARALGRRGKIAIIFDFPTPEQREISDTVRFIAGMSEFVVVDLTDASSVPLELQATVPDLMVPVLPVIQAGRRTFAMFSDLQRRYFWVQPTLQYRSTAELVRHVDDDLIARAQEAARLIRERRAGAQSHPITVAQAASGGAGTVAGRRQARVKAPLGVAQK
jgi:Pentapeptide repeats (8 copies)